MDVGLSDSNKTGGKTNRKMNANNENQIDLSLSKAVAR